MPADLVADQTRQPHGTRNRTDAEGGVHEVHEPALALALDANDPVIRGNLDLAPAIANDHVQSHVQYGRGKAGKEQKRHRLHYECHQKHGLGTEAFRQVPRRERGGNEAEGARRKDEARRGVGPAVGADHLRNRRAEERQADAE